MSDLEMENESLDPNHYTLFSMYPTNDEAGRSVTIVDDIDIDWGDSIRESTETPTPMERSFTVLKRHETLVDALVPTRAEVIMIPSKSKRYMNKVQEEEINTKKTKTLYTFK